MAGVTELGIPRRLDKDRPGPLIERMKAIKVTLHASLSDSIASGNWGAEGDRFKRELRMSQPERYEDLVLGSGEGGKYLAWHLAKSWRRTAVVERKWIGGSCPNINCLPIKNEICKRQDRGLGS